MGNKGTKAQVDKLLQLAENEGSKKGASKAELAACLASLSDMAQTGTQAGAGPPEGLADREHQVSPERLRSMGRKLRSRLTQRSASQDPDEESVEDLFKQLNLLDSQEDSRDWASMRNWLVWCMHTNLDNMGEEDEITEQVHSRMTSRRRHHMHRQTSVDTTRSRRRLSHQLSLDAEMLTGVTAQSSLESNGET